MTKRVENISLIAPSFLTAILHRGLRNFFFNYFFILSRSHYGFLPNFFYAYLRILLLFFTVLLDEDNDVYKDNEKEDKNFKLKHSEKKMILDQNSSQASDASSTRQTRQKKAARNNSESSNGMICQSIFKVVIR